MLRFYFSGCISVCLSGYNDTEQEKNEECNPGEYFLQEDSNDMSKKACRFKRGHWYSSASRHTGLADNTRSRLQGQRSGADWQQADTGKIECADWSLMGLSSTDISVWLAC